MKLNENTPPPRHRHTSNQVYISNVLFSNRKILDMNSIQTIPIHTYIHSLNELSVDFILYAHKILHTTWIHVHGAWISNWGLLLPSMHCIIDPVCWQRFINLTLKICCMIVICFDIVSALSIENE